MTPPHEHLIGRWIGEGSGEYPTIQPFTYREILEVTALPGRPMATWRSTTTDARTGEPRHSEVGFLRSSEGRCELVLAHSFGATEIAVARLTEGGSYRFESVSIACSPTAKPISSVVRSISVAGDTLAYDTSMAAVGVDLTHHLAARLLRE